MHTASAHSLNLSSPPSGPPALHGACEVSWLHLAWQVSPAQDPLQQSASLAQWVVEQSPCRPGLARAGAAVLVHGAGAVLGRAGVGAEEQRAVAVAATALIVGGAVAQSGVQAAAAHWPAIDPGSWRQCVPGQQSVSRTQALLTAPQVGRVAQRFSPGTQKPLQQSLSMVHSNLFSLQVVVAQRWLLQAPVQHSTS